MALSNQELKEAIALLKQQAIEQEKVGNSLEGYINGLKKVKAIEEEVKRLRVLQGKLLKNARSLTGQARQDELDKLKLLRDQTNELVNQGKQLKENLKTVDKTNLLMAKGMASLVKGVAGLPNLIEKGYGKLKGFGFFEMDKAVKKSALNMGLMTENSKNFSGDIRTAAKQTSLIGVGMQDLAKMQSDYSEELGRTVMMNESGLKAMGELAAATTLGAEGTAKMTADLEQQGYSAERVSEFVEKTMNDTSKMGLNASKVIKNIQQNIKMLNKYNFKGGIKGLAKMAETTTKLGIEMNSINGMADKLFDIEGAVEMSSQLQVLGGAWANLADPFHLMYMARNDMEGLTKEIGQAAASSATFNKETGEFEITSMEMHRLRKIAEQTGVSYEDLAAAGKNAAKFSKIKGQVSFGMNDEAKEFLSNTAKLDKDGKASIEVVVDGKRTKKLVSELKQFDIDRLINEKKTLKERAEASQTFDDSLNNFVESLKVSLLPLIDSMNEKLIPKLRNLSKWLETSGWIEKIESFAKTIGSLIATVGGWIIDNPIIAAIGYASAKMLGFIADKASWFANGVMLGEGFNMTATGNGGFLSSMGKMLGGGLTKFGGGSMLKGGMMAGGLGIAGAGLGMITDEYTEEGSGWNIAGKAGAGALQGAALGALLGPLGAAAGAVIGGVIGGVSAYNSKPEDGYHDAIFNSPIHDGVASGNKLGKNLGNDFSKNRGIIQGGKITPIDNKDDLLAMKPNGPVDKTLNQNKEVKTMKIEFGEIHFKFDELKVTSPGSPGLAIDLMKDPVLMRELTRVVHVEAEKVIKGGKVSG